MRSLRPLIVAACAASLLSPAAARATCGAEGCPVVREGLGAPSSRYAFDLRYQDVTQDQLWNGTASASLADVVAAGFARGHGEVELYTRTRSWVAEGRMRITDDLRVAATLPYLQRQHRHLLAHSPVYNSSFVDTWRFEGVGDATVVANYQVSHRGGRPALSLQGGVKLPTGKTHVTHETLDNYGYGSTLEPSVRPGSGSTDWIAGAQVSEPLPWKSALPLTASVLARFNRQGTDDYRVGDELQAGLSGGFAPREWLTVLAQVNYSAHGTSVSADAEEAGHTGMKALFVSPGVSVRASSALSLYGLYQARLWGQSDEATVVATNHLVVGTTYSLGR